MHVDICENSNFVQLVACFFVLNVVELLVLVHNTGASLIVLI